MYLAFLLDPVFITILVTITVLSWLAVRTIIDWLKTPRQVLKKKHEFDFRWINVPDEPEMVLAYRGSSAVITAISGGYSAKIVLDNGLEITRSSSDLEALRLWVEGILINAHQQ